MPKMTRTVQLSQADILAINNLITEMIIGVCMALDVPKLQLTREDVELDNKLALRERFLKAAGIVSPLPVEVQDFLSRQTSAKVEEPITTTYCRPKPKGVN